MVSEWTTASLADIYDFSSGLSKPRAAFGSGFPFLSFKDVFHNSAVPKKLVELVESTERERERGSIQRGDVFLTRTSETMDELGMSSTALEDISNATFNGFTKRLRPRSSRRIAPEFARYFFRSPAFRQQVYAMSSLSTRASLNNEMLAKLSITFPTYSQQESIGLTLGAFDDRIDNLRQTNTTLEAIAQALFKSWFVDFDPVHAKAEGREPEGMDATTAALFPSEFEESELGLIPKGWIAGSLSNIAELKYGKALKSSERRAGPFPVYGSGGVTGVHDTFLVDHPSVIVGRKGTIGSLYWQETPFFPIDTVFYVLPKVSLHFCYQAMKRMGLEHLNTDAAVPGLNRDNAYRRPIVIPGNDLLTAWDSIVGTIRSKISHNGMQMESLTDLRDTLLPRLISGKLQLGDSIKSAGNEI